MANSSMDPRDRFYDEEETLARAIESHQTHMWTALPTLIEAHNTKQNTAEIQPAIKLLHVQDDGTKKWLQFPVLKDLPILYYGGGGATLTVPIQKGDEGLVVFSSRSIDKWWQQGGIQEQTAARMNHISDGILLPGLRSQKRALKNVSNTSFQLRTEKPSTDGGSHFEFHPAQDTASRAAGILPTLTMTIESGIRLNSFAGGILHAAGIALPDASLANTIGNIVHAAGHLPDIPAGIGQMIHHAINDITHNSVAGGIAHTALKAIGLNVGATRDIAERASKFAAGVSINLNSPIVQVSANLKAFGSIDAALGFFKNGIPIGGAGSGGGSSGGSSPPGPATGQPPPVQGDRWWDTIGGQGYFWYDDPSPDAGQWVADTNATGTPGTAQLDFPASPTVGTMYTAPSGTMQWRWDGTKWTSPPALPLTGGTLTGTLTIAPPSGGAWPALVLRSAATGTANQLLGYRGANLRWDLDLGNQTAEGGNNTGSDFGIARYTDAGAYIDTPLWINRSTGATAMSALILGSPLPVASGGTGATSAAGSPFLPLTGGSLSNGLHFGAATAPGGAADTSRHITLYDTGYGFSITGGTLNLVAAGMAYPFQNGGMTMPGTLTVSGNSTLNGDVNCPGRVITPRMDIYGGVFYNGYGDGWLYFNGSLRVANFNSQNDVSANGNVYSSGSYFLSGLQCYNNSGWWYCVNSLQANELYSRNNIWTPAAVSGSYLHSSGDVRADSWVYVGGCTLFNSGGWLHTQQPFSSDSTIHATSNVEAGNDFSCGNGVYRCWTHRGAKIECPGWDYDWISPFISQGYLYTTPDYSGGPYFANAGWWSDARLKRNIRDSKVDALAAIIATPVRAFEYTEYGQSLQPWVKETEAKIGIVAQELQPNIPLAVRECAWEHKSLFIDLNFVTPYLFRAVQQLAERNAALEARIAQLEAGNDRLH